MNENSSKPWLRISLRAFLVLFTCVAITVGWFSRYAHQRWSAFAAIRQAGGDIKMGIQEPPWLEQWLGAELCGTVVRVNLRNGKADNSLLVQIGVLKELSDLDLSNADIDDEGLQHIMHLPLRRLWLQETKITDASATTLSNIHSLSFLQLNATSLSDSFLVQLEPLPELENLGLRGTHVTAAGMKHLSRHTKLKLLDVYSTEVDDSGVADLPVARQCRIRTRNITDSVFEHLDKLPNLTNADLNGSHVTTEAVLAFEKSHPKCDIEWYPSDFPATGSAGT